MLLWIWGGISGEHMSYLSSNSLTLCHFSDSMQPQWHLPQLRHLDYPFAQIMKESGVCQPSTLPHQLGLHHLPARPSLGQPGKVHLLPRTDSSQMLFSVYNHQPEVQAARRSLLKIPTMHDTFALGSEKGPWRLIEFTPKSLSGVCPGYALCSYIQLPLKNIYHIISICLLISHP